MAMAMAASVGGGADRGGACRCFSPRKPAIARSRTRSLPPLLLPSRNQPWRAQKSRNWSQSQHRSSRPSRVVLSAAAASSAGDGGGSTQRSLPPSIFPAKAEVVGVKEASKKEWTPPKPVLLLVATLVLSGQVVSRVFQRKINLRNLMDQIGMVGPRTLGVSMLTASFVGMVFTIQFVREFARLGLTRSVGGVLALAFSRELSPVITAIVLAGRVGSAFAAELGTMQVSEQTDSLRVLRADPVDYLVVPRVLACMISLPILTLICFCTGLASSAFLADAVYGIAPPIILDSAQSALVASDIWNMITKSLVFGGIVSLTSCTFGTTTTGGAKGVGESTTAAVVASLVSIFISDFILSFFFLNSSSGDALRRVV